MMLEKEIQKWFPNGCQTGAKREHKIHPIFSQRGAKESPKRPEKKHAQNERNKGTKLEVGWSQCAWPILVSSWLIRFTRLLATWLNTAGAPRPRRAVLSPQSGSHGAPRKGVLPAKQEMNVCKTIFKNYGKTFLQGRVSCAKWWGTNL